MYLDKHTFKHTITLRYVNEYGKNGLDSWHEVVYLTTYIFYVYVSTH